MSKKIWSFTIAFSMLLSSINGSKVFAQRNNKIYKYVNGNWFNGLGFEKKIIVTQGGFILGDTDLSADSIIDLKNKYVVPPYGEAHNHNIGTNRVKISNSYLKSGIFYVKNPSNWVKSRIPNPDVVHPEIMVDVSYSNTGFTCKSGHPSAFSGLGPRGPDGFVIEVESESDVDNIWSDYIEHDPDFVKVFLLMSSKRNDPGQRSNFKGLNPKLVPYIVKKAHESGLRVSSHVESAYDFHLAVNAGVDEVNHLPGFRGDPALSYKTKDFEQFKIANEDAKLAGENKIFVVTTIGALRAIPKIFTIRRKADKLFRYNLLKLKEFNVPIAFGSDAYDLTD